AAAATANYRNVKIKILVRLHAETIDEVFRSYNDSKKRTRCSRVLMDHFYFGLLISVAVIATAVTTAITGRGWCRPRGLRRPRFRPLGRSLGRRMLRSRIPASIAASRR